MNIPGVSPRQTVINLPLSRPGVERSWSAETGGVGNNGGRSPVFFFLFRFLLFLLLLQCNVRTRSRFRCRGESVSDRCLRCRAVSRKTTFRGVGKFPDKTLARPFLEPSKRIRPSAEAFRRGPQPFKSEIDGSSRTDIVARSPKISGGKHHKRGRQTSRVRGAVFIRVALGDF